MAVKNLNNESKSPKSLHHFLAHHLEHLRKTNNEKIKFLTSGLALL